MVVGVVSLFEMGDDWRTRPPITSSRGDCAYYSNPRLDVTLREFLWILLDIAPHFVLCTCGCLGQTSLSVYLDCVVICVQTWVPSSYCEPLGRKNYIMVLSVPLSPCLDHGGSQRACFLCVCACVPLPTPPKQSPVTSCGLQPAQLVSFSHRLLISVDVSLSDFCFV